MLSIKIGVAGLIHVFVAADSVFCQLTAVQAGMEWG